MNNLPPVPPPVPGQQSAPQGATPAPGSPPIPPQPTPPGGPSQPNPLDWSAIMKGVGPPPTPLDLLMRLPPPPTPQKLVGPRVPGPPPPPSPTPPGGSSSGVDWQSVRNVFNDHGLTMNAADERKYETMVNDTQKYISQIFKDPKVANQIANGVAAYAVKNSLSQLQPNAMDKANDFVYKFMTGTKPLDLPVSELVKVLLEGVHR
jgi:hypothetical protein